MSQVTTALQGLQEPPTWATQGTQEQVRPDSLLSEKGIQILFDPGKKRPVSTRGLALHAIENARAMIQRRRALVLEAENSQLEMDWLRRHRGEYAGRWVAIRGDELIAVANSAAEVYAAIAGRVDVPLVTQLLPEQEEPFAGW
jgi:Family of unknown function (DUF5678)